MQGGCEPISVGAPGREPNSAWAGKWPERPQRGAPGAEITVSQKNLILITSNT